MLRAEHRPIAFTTLNYESVKRDIARARASIWNHWPRCSVSRPRDLTSLASLPKRATQPWSHPEQRRRRYLFPCGACWMNIPTWCPDGVCSRK
jgi:hypothetical protein